MSRSPARSRAFLAVSVAIVALVCPCRLVSAEIPSGARGFSTHVMPLLKTHCVMCHGPQQSKGNLVLHALDGDLRTGKDQQRWALILEKLERKEMPPEGQPQLDDSQRAAVVTWIEAGLRENAAQSAAAAEGPTARRLTNVEYENTMRDLLGFRLKLIDRLPKDPVKPYRFHNSATFMQLGPEQIDRYLECARHAMASAIVDPVQPDVHQTRRQWQPHGVDRGLGADEVGVWGNRRNTPATGMGLRSFPERGEYRIRMKASAILPPGIKELPLRLVMGYSLGENSATLQIEPVGAIRLRNNPDAPEIFEFRGRIENHPPRPGRVIKGVRKPSTMAITPQNLYDDGTLNDGRRDLMMPRAIVEWIEFEAPIVEQWPPARHRKILFDSPLRESDPTGYVRAVLHRFMSRAYRRPVTEEEVSRFADIYNLLLTELKTQEAAMRETLAMVLISPQFLYHTMANDRTSHQYELAAKLSYFLWASMPDDELMQLAADGKLDDPAVIDKQVRRLLADARSHDFVDNFTRQWLSLAKTKTVPINRELFPRFLYYVSAGERAGTEVPYRPTIRDYMLQETVGFVGELIRRNASVLNIVDSDFVYLNQPLAAHYGVAGVQGNHLRPVPVKPEDRLGGLLTQGAVLIGNGTGSAPHPIYRAVWLREAILGDEVPPPPAEVPALSDSAGETAEKALTIKDLLAKHRQKESCNQCHARLDPWGIPFERYNAIGRYQPMAPKEGTRVRGFNKQQHKDLAGYVLYLQSINTVPVAADADLPNGPNVDGMQELKNYLLEHRKDDIVENVIRRLLTYAVGRELTYRDRFAVKALLQRSKANDFKLQDIIVSICQSGTFRGANPEDQ